MLKIKIDKSDVWKKTLALLLLIISRSLYVYITKNVLYELGYDAIHPHYGIDYNIIKDGITCVLFMFESVMFLALSRESELKENILTMLFVLYLMPLNAVSALTNADIIFLILSNLFIIEIILVLSVNPAKKNDNPVLTVAGEMDSLVFEDKRLRAVCFIVCVLFITYKISLNGYNFSLTLISGSNYENRQAMIDLVNTTATSLMGRITTIISNLVIFIAPVYLLISIRLKKPIEIIVALLANLSIFALYFMKTNLLLVPVVIGIAFFYKGKKRINYLIIAGMTAGIAVTVAQWIITEKTTLYYIFVRRMMYDPTWLNTIYYDFFSSNPKLMLTDEVFLFKKILPHVYDKNVLGLISLKYFGVSTGSPNNGMFAEGYMHFGIIGVVVFPIIYGFMFHWINQVYCHFSKQLNLLVAVIIAISLPNVGFFRSSFVMSFILMTILILIMVKIKLKVRGS